ncbi:hypothetical protein [Microseira wollei]|uniref:XRE family transcriptional regulator n=1 Tax=Microseira wollei NIES-4236 TaxID=2530354 RepID=A0AAV3XCS2_9CYAN|nr:hypothetical protein [Microseira wollei]GET39216.1 hypothetical protein MiSe_39800 [Microseira wollei NIES-4236]
MELDKRANSSETDPRGTLLNFIRELRDSKGIPINFIEADEQVEVSWSTIDQEVETVLNTTVNGTGCYRWRLILGHYVVYPSDRVWDTKVCGIGITNVPRLEAATQYVTAVQTQIPALNDLLAPPIKGEPRAPVYIEPVSLHPEFSIVENLVELLGTNDQLAFTIEYTLSERRVLYFQQVLTSK